MVQNCEPVQVAGEEMIQFTAAIPTYNGGSGYLSKVLDALLKQKTKVEWELIVVDNNSKDDTKKQVMKYKKKFRNLRYVFERKQGQAYARQKAVDEARIVPDNNFLHITAIQKYPSCFRFCVYES